VSDRVHQFRIFIQVADMESFVGAARVLKIPPATVSAAIRMLEAELGVRLLHRTTRQVNLTAEGEKLLPMARKISSDLEAIYSMLHADQDAVSGRFALDVPSRIAARVIAPALPAFLHRHPALELHVCSNDRHVDLAKEGIDCVIRVGESRDDGLLRKPLGVLEMVTCASPTYLAEHKAPQHPEDLANHFAVGYSPSSSVPAAVWSLVDTLGNSRSIAMKHRVVVNNVESYLASCRVGLGLIQMPRFDVHELLERGELVEVLNDWVPPPVPIAALYLYRYQRSHRMGVIIDWLQSLLGHAISREVSAGGVQ
jgi:DNA-binding transcriptional LysR family regulator